MGKFSFRLGLLFVVLGVGCTGQVDGDGAPAAPLPVGSPGGSTVGTAGGPGQSNGGAGGMAGTVTPPVAIVAGAGPMPLRRLTRVEYNNTIRDLFVDLRGNHSSEFPSDAGSESGFASAGPVGKVELDRIQSAAERISKLALSRFDKISPCMPAAAGEDVCARQFVEKFGRRAYRRPLTDTEVAELQQIYKAMRAKMYSFNEAIGVVIEAMIGSPDFLYRWELGAQPAKREGALIRLSPHEVASRLSYFLWSSMPDAALFAAADAGALSTPEQVDVQIKRMLSDPKARETVASFFDQILETDNITTLLRDSKKYPEFTDALKLSMEKEVRAFTSDLVLEGDGRVETLLGASYSFVDGNMAKFYGIVGVTGSAVVKRDLDPNERFGLLTMPSVLAVHADPFPIIKRGAVVRKRIICQDPPPPPGDVPPPPPRSAGLSDREFLLQQHETVPSCAGCHRLIDHIGFGFDAYDSIGKVRATDNGKNLVTSGTIWNIDNGDKTFTNAKELSRVLATSNEVRSCLAKQWGRFALARPETSADEASLQEAFGAFARSNFNMRELIVGIAKSKTFLFRTPASKEVTQ